MDKKKSAISLKYTAPEAPKLTAKGFADLADEMIELARESGVMVHEDKELVNYLARLDVGSQIPKDVYIIIAEIIAWSYIVRGKQPEHFNNIHNRIEDKA